MSNNNQSRLLRAVYSCLRPLVRVLIRAGVTYGQFSGLAKLAFVQEAYQELDEKGRAINASRVAVKTGISRKEVRRIRQAHLHKSASPLFGNFEQAATPAQVLHHWYLDQAYLDSNGNPRPLPLTDSSPSFTELVRTVSGDVPLGAVKAELIQAGAVEETDDGLIRVKKRFYVPSDFDEKAIAVISGMLYPMTAGMAHNADARRTTDGFIQRLAFSRTLDMQETANFRRWARVQATDFIESMDKWLGAHEQASTSGVRIPEADLVAVGVFYFEGPPDLEDQQTIVK